MNLAPCERDGAFSDGGRIRLACCAVALVVTHSVNTIVALQARMKAHPWLAKFLEMYTFCGEADFYLITLPFTVSRSMLCRLYLLIGAHVSLSPVGCVHGRLCRSFGSWTPRWRAA